MTRRLKRIAPLQAGKVLAALYGCMGLIFLPFFALAGLLGAFAGHNQSGAGALAAGFIIGMGIFMPIIYAVMGFIFGILGAAVYNLIAGWIGGFEVEVE